MTEEIESSLLRTRALELFKICDIENKGFINRKDFLRLKDSLGESPEILEEYFDSLDCDGNGFLTLDEFISAFSNSIDNDSGNSSVQNQEDDDVFKETMESLGVPNHLIEKFVNLFNRPINVLNLARMLKIYDKIYRKNRLVPAFFSTSKSTYNGPQNFTSQINGKPHQIRQKSHSVEYF